MKLAVLSGIDTKLSPYTGHSITDSSRAVKFIAAKRVD